MSNKTFDVSKLKNGEKYFLICHYRENSEVYSMRLEQITFGENGDLQHKELEAVIDYMNKRDFEPVCDFYPYDETNIRKLTAMKEKLNRQKGS